ncbi:MAG: fumarylacetoacetate hydrolase family protein [Rhodobacteraceae bacterium]|nr:fumarylacetoacetate hydrolase family protein [Paracoccaceae bacterium]
MSRSKTLTVIALAGLTGPAFAGCASDAEIAAFVADVAAKTPTKALSAGGSIEDARCTQAKLAKAIEPVLGPVVGYKVGLTSKPVQERFGLTEPVQGVLYGGGLVPSGASVPAAFGAIPLYEADLILVVGSDSINGATTIEEALAHISAIRPFMELPDLTLAQGEPITGVTLTAMGVAPRMGVMGDDIPVEDTASLHTALAEMTVTMTDGAGNVVSEAPGAAVMGHPVNSVLWLMSKGIALKQGDLISVGAFGPLVPTANANGGATLTYTGLPGDPSISVTFTE